ncbi:MAG TPA: cell wall-binding repeat-containing protein, partial [Actinomycetes bacterium]|nr:cell wall-binding repeat-containing protein [Actinomycetes bacterium]
FAAGTRHTIADYATRCPLVRGIGLTVMRGATASVTSVRVDQNTPEGVRSPQLSIFRQDPGAGWVYRVGGPDRIDTALRAARMLQARIGQFDAAVLGRADGFADNLAGTALAKTYRAPLLLTGRTQLDARVAKELTTSVRPGGTVYLLGGTAALSPQVEQAVAALGFTVKRLAGADRFATAVAIFDQLVPHPEPEGQLCQVSLADGLNFPDALVAANLDKPIIFSAGSTLPPTTSEFLRRCDVGRMVTVVGGPAARALAGSSYAGALWFRYVGADRYGTSEAVLRAMAPTDRRPLLDLSMATGENFPDALVAATLGVTVLSPPDAPRESLHAIVSDMAPYLNAIYLLGDTDVLSDTVGERVKSWMAGQTTGHIVSPAVEN